jgi:hypothetical protein
LTDRIRRAPRLTKCPSHIHSRLPLPLDLVPRLLLLRLLPVQIAREVLLFTCASGTKGVVVRDGGGDFAFARRRHLRAVELVVPTYVFFGQAAGFLAWRSTLGGKVSRVWGV